MSKQDKERADIGDSAELTAELGVAVDETQALSLTAAAPEQTAGQSEQSRQFNSWLDRALPRLMEYLGQGTTSAVTSPGPKAKH